MDEKELKPEEMDSVSGGFIPVKRITDQQSGMPVKKEEEKSDPNLRYLP